MSSDNHQASTFFIINNKRAVEVSASGGEPSGPKPSNSWGIRLQRAGPSGRSAMITMSPSRHRGYVLVGRVPALTPDVVPRFNIVKIRKVVFSLDAS